MNFLPEQAIQPLAWSVALLVVLTLIAGNQSGKKRKFSLFVSGVFVSYLMAFALQWQPAIGKYLTFYGGLFAAVLLVVFGAHALFRFFNTQSIDLHPKVARDIEKLQAAINRAIPIWGYGLVGILTGIIEPLRIQSSQYIEWFLLITQPSLSAVMNVLTYIVAALLPIIAIGGVGLLLQRTKQKNPPAFLLWAAGSTIITGWLLFAIAGQLLLL